MSNDQGSKTVIDCDSTIDIKIAAELYSHLKNAIDNNHLVEINATEVQRVDTAVLQVFLAFMLEAEAKGMTVTWQGVSDGFRKAAILLGITEQLSLPEAA